MLRTIGLLFLFASIPAIAQAQTTYITPDGSGGWIARTSPGVQSQPFNFRGGGPYNLNTRPPNFRELPNTAAPILDSYMRGTQHSSTGTQAIQDNFLQSYIGSTMATQGPAAAAEAAFMGGDIQTGLALSRRAREQEKARASRGWQR